ncbi:MAG: histidine kinase [Mariniphaga sp.]|nr:histidine kinase [Mariniphaga sp.]
MDHKITRKYIVLTIWLSLSISILVHFSRVFDETISHSSIQSSTIYFVCNILSELLITFVICSLLFLINFYILKPLQTNKTHKPVTIIIALLVSFSIVLILSHYLFQLKGLMFPRVEAVRHEGAFVFKDFFVALVVIICIYVIKVIYQNQQNRLEIQDLRIENLQRQFDALKNQVSPHFLFNSLNSLKTLIREAPEVAQEYLNHLSSVLRYTLQANENKLVSLNDELLFVESYFFLIKLRFNKNISLFQNISNKLMEYRIPPLALQILIENAIKHNEISKRNPLEISVSTTDDTLVVKNNINKKFSPETGTGLGLVNLSNQYRILAGKEVLIKNDGSNFVVEIPLLKP